MGEGNRGGILWLNIGTPDTPEWEPLRIPGK